MNICLCSTVAFLRLLISLSNALQQPKYKKIQPCSTLTLVYLMTFIITSTHLFLMQRIYIVGGHIIDDQIKEKGNVFTVPSNEYAEFNMFLDPLAAKTVIDSDLNITLIPLKAQHIVTSFPAILENLEFSNSTPESSFTHGLLSLLQKLQKKHSLYRHMVIDGF